MTVMPWGLGLSGTLGKLGQDGGGRSWALADLGASLLACWDAERADTLTLAGSLVSSWADTVGGLAAAQASTSFKPAYSTTSFNGRPGITFDGTDDFLVNVALAANALPTGANPSEIWVLCNHTLAAAVAGNGTIFLYGSSGSNNRRTVRRIVGAGTVNRAQANVGTGGGATAISDTVGDFSGYHVLVSKTDAVNSDIALEANAPVSGAVVPNTLNSAIAIGAVTGGTGVFTGSINKILVTAPLDSGQRAQLLAYLKSIGGIA